MLVVLIPIEGYWAPGLTVGARFGLLIGLFTSIPVACATYAMMPIPYSLAFQRLVYGTVQRILLGVGGALIWSRLADASAPRPA